MQKGNTRVISTLFILVGAGAVLVAALMWFGMLPRQQGAASVPPAVSAPSDAADDAAPPDAANSDIPPQTPALPVWPPQPAEQQLYPVGRLFVTQERLDYLDSTLVLRVPRLDLKTPVLGQTDPDDKARFLAGEMTPEQKAAFLRNDNSASVLSQGVMLFQMSPLPGAANANVSISGHRDICGMEFYDIDKLGEGDLIYLDYFGHTYVYRYYSTTVVEPNDWAPLYCNEYSCVTLISCHPIGTTRQRMVVQARLVGIEESELQSGQGGGVLNT